MVIFVTKTSCPRREMTSLALTVCAHIATTHYTPRFCAFEYRFLPFQNLTPNPPSALPYASRWWRGWEGGWGWLRRVCPLPRWWWRCWEGGRGWLRRLCHLSRCWWGCWEGGWGWLRGLCLRPRRWWGQWEVSCAGPQRCRGQSGRKPARTLAHSLATP